MGSDRKVISYIAASLDGYIAGKEDDLGFLAMVEQEGQDYGYKEFMQTIDTIIIGRRTYDKIISMGFPYPGPDNDVDVYVVTHQDRPAIGRIRYYTGDLTALINEIKSKPGKNIFCDGGAEIVNLLLRQQQIDEIVLSVIPVLLGDGIRLFNDGRPEQKLVLQSSTAFEKGLVQLHYIVA